MNEKNNTSELYSALLQLILQSSEVYIQKSCTYEQQHELQFLYKLVVLQEIINCPCCKKKKKRKRKRCGH